MKIIKRLFILFVLSLFVFSCEKEVKKESIKLLFLQCDSESKNLEIITDKNDLVLIPTIQWEKEGCDFIGWSSKENGKVEYISNQKYKFENNTTLYPIWSANDIKLVFLSGELDGKNVEKSTKYGAKTLIPMIGWEKTGYKFAGWSKSKNGNVEYLPNKEYTFTSNTTLYPIWSSNDIKLVFLSGELDGKNVEKTTKYGAKTLIPMIGWEKTGYKFAGWSKSENGNVEYLPNKEYTFTSNTTLYPIWLSNDIKLVFLSGELEGKNVEKVTKYGAKTLIPMIGWEKTGYKFAGWSKSENGNVEYLPNKEYTFTSNTTLYPIWSANDIKLVFLSGELEGKNVEKVTKYGAKTLIPMIGWEKVGYKFAGWSKSKNGNVEYLPNKEYTFTSNTTLYPIWSAKLVTIFLCYNNGTDDKKIINAKYGDEIKIEVEGLKRSGYVLLGWSSKNDNRVEFNDKSNYKITQEGQISFYAIWKEDTTTGGDSDHNTGDTSNNEFRNVTKMVYNVNIPPVPKDGTMPSRFSSTSKYLKKNENKWYTGKDLFNTEYLTWGENCGWYDCVKTLEKGVDYRQCWAAATADILYWWLNNNKKYVERYLSEHPDLHMPSMDFAPNKDAEIFKFYNNKFQDIGGWSNAGFMYFMLGKRQTLNGLPPKYNSNDDFNGFFQDLFPKNDTEGVGVVSDVRFSGSKRAKEIMTEEIKKALIKDRGITIVAYYPGYGAHSMVVWGADFDKDGYVSHLYYCDNNDSAKDNDKPGNACIYRQPIVYDDNGAYFESPKGYNNISISALCTFDLMRSQWKKLYPDL